MRISDWSSDVCSSDLPARPVPGGRRGPGGERLLPRGHAAASHGVRRRGAEAGRHLPGRQRWLTDRQPRYEDHSEAMLEIKNLHATVGGKPILKGIDLTVKDRKSTRLNSSH